MSYSTEGDGPDDIPFFADATLDLEEARGIAATPDLTLKASIRNSIEMQQALGVPSLDLNVTPVKGAANATSNTNISTNGNGSSHSNDTTSSNASAAAAATCSSPSNSNSNTRRASNYSVHAIQNTNAVNQPTYRPRPPRRPRDAKWTMTFLLTLPLLSLPYILCHSYNKVAYHQIEKVDLPIILTLVIGVLLARVFYLDRGGGEGEDRRYLASQILIIANTASCFILPLLFISFYNLRVSGLGYDLIVFGLAYWTMRDIYIFAKLFKSGRIMVEGVNDGQRAFYRMLVNASLDILSRSLRCQSFYRTVVGLLCAQFVVLLGIRKALAYAFLMPGPYHTLLVMLVAVIGYWCVNVVIRLLSYLACGGVTSWFAQQSTLMEDMERMRRREEGDDFDQDVIERNGNPHSTAMPEAYRNVDASAYSLGIEFDEGMDDDYGDGDADVYSSQTNGRWNTAASGGANSASTVKAFFASALGNSFGSIVHCALVGGAANIAWSFLRTVDWITASSSRFAPLRQGNFRGMSVGDDFSSNASEGGSLIERLFATWQRLMSASRAFVRNHNDLALCHVAAYYKSYTRAANDVMSLIDASGE